MMPIPGYEAVRCTWLRIEAEGFVLHGFLLYTLGDHPFPDYLEGSGLMDLDGWTGHECAMFIIHPPSEAWIDYTSNWQHSWWRVFGNAEPETLKRLSHHLAAVGSVPVPFDGERRTLSSILAPPVNMFAHRKEVERVLEKFCCAPTQHPCLILFKSLRQRDYWYVGLQDMLGKPIATLRTALRTWFGGKVFKRILAEARHA
ncbi:MAG: hypothetical protein JOY71_03290 [Acetobacteraceae bacterium]|nr:hypothetical protein [Acetobacteraceae bacterium]